ncbi:MAG TPA: hypothetical protein VE046_01415 [Steroidobacteraceae bacterium]|nr:hypothetical protein [Steroidobacteraceae bacterium]
MAAGSTARSQVRILSPQDVPGAAALFARIRPEFRWSSRHASEAYFHQILFENPWRHLDVPSWVAEEDGRLCGLYVVLPRPMLFRGHAIRAAIGCQFLVDPAARDRLTALRLAQACLSGSQDLTLADAANERARRMLLGLGGCAPPLLSLHWTRILRAGRHALALCEERRTLPPRIARVMRPLGTLVDALVGRASGDRSWRAIGRTVDAQIDATEMLDHLHGGADPRALQPVYDRVSLGWLLEQSSLKTRHGNLRARGVRDDAGGLIGWYLYYLRPGALGEVIHISASPAAYPTVLKHLLADAWHAGATALRGRVDPRFAQEMSDCRCWFRWEGAWTLAHSRDSAIVAAIQSGDACLSRLAGEWWLRFAGG